MSGYIVSGTGVIIIIIIIIIIITYLLKSCVCSAYIIRLVIL